MDWGQRSKELGGKGEERDRKLGGDTGRETESAKSDQKYRQKKIERRRTGEQKKKNTEWKLFYPYFLLAEENEWIEIKFVYIWNRCLCTPTNTDDVYSDDAEKYPKQKKYYKIREKNYQSQYWTVFGLWKRIHPHGAL